VTAVKDREVRIDVTINGKVDADYVRDHLQRQLDPRGYERRRQERIAYFGKELKEWDWFD